MQSKDLDQHTGGTPLTVKVLIWMHRYLPGTQVSGENYLPLRTHTQRELEPRKSTDLPWHSTSISEIKGNVSSLTQDTPLQGSLDVKCSGLSVAWEGNGLGKEMLNGMLTFR